ncbi:MAG: cation-transporting P-type ATPase, partial [Actinobacteria bacterium]
TPGIMKRPPRSQAERRVNMRLLTRAQLFLGSFQAVACMAAFYFLYWTYGWRPGESLWAAGAVAVGGSTVYILATTMCHGAVMTTQIGNGFAQRTNVQSIFKIGFGTNKFLLWGIVAEIAMFSALVYIPGLAEVFHHGPIRLWPDWAFLFALAPLLLVVDEIRKLFVRRKLAKAEVA